MANYLTTDTELTSVADAIRAKGGTSAQLTYPTEFVSAIQAIPTGGGSDELAKRLIQKLAADKRPFAIPSGTTAISAYAFAYAEFGGVTIPSSVTTLWAHAFRYYRGSGTLTIPSTVTTWWSPTTGYYFADIGQSSDPASDKPDIVLQTDLPNNAAYAFSNSYLNSVTLASTTAALPDHCFYKTSLQEAPDLSNITYFAASSCASAVGNSSSLNGINQNTTFIGNYAFHNNGFNVDPGTIPASLTSGLGQEAFTNCTRMQTLKIKCSTLGTGNTTSRCFGGCTGLRYVWISKDCTKIFGNAASYSPFNGCSTELKIYTDATAKLTGWSSYWNNVTSSTKIKPEDYDGWGVTEEQFDEIVANAGL